MNLKLRGAMAAMAAAGCLAAAPASAAVMLATFTGTVESGDDYTDFFNLGGVLNNASFTAIFKYDTSLGAATTGPMVDVRSGGPAWGGGVSPILSASLMINGVTDAFATFGNGSANVTINATGWEQTFFYTDTSYDLGSITDYTFLRLFVLSVPTPLLLTTPYVGGNKDLGSGPETTNIVTHFRTDGGVNVINYAGSFLTQQVVLSRVAVPEPGTWLLMIAGFGGVGLMLRRRSSIAV